MDYLKDFKKHLKVIKNNNGSVGYHPGLTEAVLLEKHNIDGNVASEYKKKDATIEERGR